MDAKSAFLNNDLQTFVEKNCQLQPDLIFYFPTSKIDHFVQLTIDANAKLFESIRIYD